MKSISAFTAARVLAATLLFSSLSALTIHAQDSSVAAPTVPIKVRNGDASAVAPVSGSKQLQLAISLPLRNEAALDALLDDIYNPQSPNFHHYLSPEEFTERFSPSQADYDAVVQWAQSKGLRVTHTTPNRRVIDVTGTADVIRRTFNVGLNDYRDNITSAVFHAPDREPTVDSPVALLGVSGLDNALPPRPHLVKGDALISTSGTIVESANAIARITGSGPGNTYLPSDMRKAYYGNGPLTGAGQTVAIFSYDGYIKNDINVYYSSTGMTSTVPVNNVLVNGYNGACFGFNANGTINPNICDDGEQILDIVNVIGMAPGLTQVLFYEGDSSTDVLNQMATDNIAKVISSSWGGGDFGTVSDPIFKQFQAQGISYLNATGDSGQFNSSTYFPPSVDANITQVGGTNLTTTGAGGPWASEVGWPDSGGGFFAGTAIPTYQQLPGVINSSNKGSTTLRNAPDVAAEANFDNTTVINGVFKSGYGGTSFATPRWAGLIALANQQSIANGQGTMGFLNPTIYNIGLGANFAANFHDITSGNNRPTQGSGTGFNAVAGYDLVTGWGSPIGTALIATLTGSVATPDYSLTASPTSVSVAQGGNGTSTIAVTAIAGFSGSVALSASGLPSGVSASFSPASTTSTSTLTLTASSTATVGAATVTITGTSGTLTHTTTVTLTVTAVNNAPTLTSVTPNSGVQGAAVNVTLTGTNFIAGATVAVTGSGITVSNVAVVSGTQITATLTIAAGATAGARNVSVATTAGTSGTVPFTVGTASGVPTLASIAPSSGALGTSVDVTLTGTNFTSGSRVGLQGVGLKQTNIVVVSPTQITATFIISASAAIGPHNTTVATSAGTSNIVSFTVTAAGNGPTLTSVSPNSGVQGTAVNVTLTGTNFIAGASVAATGSGIAVNNLTVTSATQITATLNVAANATVGQHNLSVTTSAGTSGNVSFSVTAAAVVPTLTSISPSTGAQGASIPVTLTGTGFVAPLSLNSGTGITVSNVSVVSATTATATLTIAANAATGGHNVSVTTAGGTSGNVSFSITSAAVVPTLTSISPSSGSQGSSVPVTLTGTGFVAPLTFNSGSGITVSNVSVVSATSATATLTIAANAATGGHNVSVTTAGGTSGNVSFSITSAAVVPTLTSISPSSGSQGSSVPVTLTGTGFVAPLTFNSGSGITVSNVSVVSATSATATLTIAAGATLGASSVSVTTAGGTSNSATFTVTPASTLPTLSSVTPSSGARGTSVNVTLTGTNFMRGSQVGLQGVGLKQTNIVVVSPTQITATFTISPSAATGPHNTSVTTSAGNSNVLTFTVN